MTAGYRAGAMTALLLNNVNSHLATHEHTDVCISRLDELIPILEKGFRRMTTEEKLSEINDAVAKWKAEEMLKEGNGGQVWEGDGKAEETWEGEGKAGGGGRN
jgi:hypothetical protein